MKKGDDVILYNIYYVYDKILKIMKYINSYYFLFEIVFKVVWVLIKGEGYLCCVLIFEFSFDINV